MKRIILTGILVVATGVFGLMAQQQKDQKGQQKGQQNGQQKGAPSVPQETPGDLKLMQQLVAAQNNPDLSIQTAEELLQKYPDSAYKESALLLQGNAYQAKREPMKAQITFEQVLQINPKNIQANLGAGEVIIQQTGEKDLDREDKLTKAESYLNATMEGTKGPKPNPNMTDAAWADAAQGITAQAHNDLGLIALTRKNYDLAATEFKTAADLDPGQPTYFARQASSLQAAGKSTEAVAVCDKLLADPQLNPAIKNFVQTVKNAAQKTSPVPAPAN